MSSNPEPCNFVIFGASGNLVQEKLLPALYQLEAGEHFGESLRFIAIARRDWSQAQWLELVRKAIQQRLGKSFDKAVFAKLAERFEYVAGNHLEDETYTKLKEAMAKPRTGVCENNVFYLAIPPADFFGVATALHKAKLSGGAHRLVVEKPFGDDIESARKLNSHLHKYFDEEQVFRIDHYLGKETVQNLLVLRFANTLIEPIWNRNYIDYVQITVAEAKGISTRAGYYDHAGALRDMVQNHLMQLLSVVAMEPPAQLDADGLRDEKVKVLRSIRPIPLDSVDNFALRAQYGAGKVAGEAVHGYLDEPGVQPQSNTETYVAAKFYVDNWRWSGVPFYLRTGKALAESMSLIAVGFKDPPRQLFRGTALAHNEPNTIVFSLQPRESMHIELNAKQPGLELLTRPAKLFASYTQDQEKSTEAYEALLLDVIEGDRTLFIRFDEVEWAWQVVDPILRHWAQLDAPILTYPAGSWGPEQATRLFDSARHVWRNKV